MLKKNEEYIVEIIDNGFQGEGIAKIDGLTIFVSGAIKGEKIKIKILKVTSDLAYAKILEILEQSPLRVEEDCTTYKRCGGCNLRHIKYEETLNIKRQNVENCLYKSLKRKIKVNDVIGMQNPLYYRNKLQYPLGLDRDSNPVMGIYSSRTHDIIPVKKCNIQNELCQDIARDVFEFIKQHNIKVYDEKTLKGTVRHIIVRIGLKTNEVLLTIVVNDNNFKYEKELVQYLTSKYSQIKSIVKNYNMKNTNVILGSKNEVIFGSGYIYDILDGYKFKISPLSFYQVNPVQTEILYNTAINYVKDNNHNVLLDLYCGIGTIGIFASKKFKKVYGIEIIQDAIKDAKVNAEINEIENIEFFAGAVEKILPKLVEEKNVKPDVVIVDPPRKGLDSNTIKLLLNLKPKQIIYISCNPATLARDLKLLEQSYDIEEVQPIDCFCFTNHCEAVVSLNMR